MNNIILQTDSYKISHWKQYPPGTTHVYSYFESRGGAYKNVVFFGLQYILKKHLIGAVVDGKKIDEAERFFEQHFGNRELFNRLGWEHIIKDHNFRLPVEIKAVAEGSVIPTSNVLFTIENTCPQCFWVTSYLETLLSQVWYPSTVATKSFEMKKVLKYYLDITGSDTPDFKLHDFGYRGSTSQESAGIGDAAHLINFKGTDTLAGIVLTQEYYGEKSMPAFSIPATEHSTITSWGKENEAEAYKNMLKQFPSGLIAVVSDSYDIYNAVENLWGKELKDLVLQREGILVIRPDSGDPTVVLPKVLQLLGDKFGYEVNENGYRVLPNKIRLIQGDGVDEDSLAVILYHITTNKWSADNIAFGSGGGLLQNVTRDTMRFAFKCSNITIDGEDRPVFKNPVTDPGKKSKKGKLKLLKVGGNWMTANTDKLQVQEQDQLQTVFRNGELLIDQSFEDIRKRTAESL